MAEFRVVGPGLSLVALVAVFILLEVVSCWDIAIFLFC